MLLGVLIAAIVGGVFFYKQHRDNSRSTTESSNTPAQSASKTDSPCGSLTKPPHYKHVVWIWEENKDESDVVGKAPYIDSLIKKCASATNIIDNATVASLPSEPQYAAGTSGSNCNQGITSASGSGTGCIVNNGEFGPANSLSTQSIFQLVKNSGGSWKSYQESMPSNCALKDSHPYAFKHNPAAFYTQLAADCAKRDVAFPGITCPDHDSAACSTPTGLLADDIAAGHLATFTFITPDLNNDMHDGTVAQGDNWLKTYLSLFINGPNYQAGDTVIFIMWDEGSSNANTSNIPSLFIAPSIKPGTVISKASNNIGLLKTAEDVLGLKPYIGCSSGTPPGNIGKCNPESSVSLVSELNL